MLLTLYTDILFNCEPLTDFLKGDHSQKVQQTKEEAWRLQAAPGEALLAIEVCSMWQKRQGPRGWEYEIVRQGSRGPEPMKTRTELCPSHIGSCDKWTSAGVAQPEQSKPRQGEVSSEKHLEPEAKPPWQVKKTCWAGLAPPWNSCSQW